MAGPYINESGYEVPEGKILVVPTNKNNDGFYKEIIQSLKGEIKRDWFNSHFYYCLPINIGSQYGFIIKSCRDFEMYWNGSLDSSNDIVFNFLNDEEGEKRQIIKSGFSQGVVTIQNHFSLKTPLGVNIMTIQPPNMFLPGCVALTGVIETDQIRRDFTFNIKITVPNMVIKVNKGDALGAFITVPRYYVDSFDIDLVTNHFSEEIYDNELRDAQEFGRQRQGEDKEKAHQSGRKYFNGIHAEGELYLDHQKKLN